MHPAAAVIIVGCITDIGLLATSYARGARGLRFGTPTDPASRCRPQTGLATPTQPGTAHHTESDDRWLHVW